ncbi:hypothetical protein SUNI508_07664 [Seiridium unicorne]|uniref:Hemerythrin n=1 Tax=Seiridium unicorne TaxID=138068 RepID=A0ABR2UWA1_9PEZI
MALAHNVLVRGLNSIHGQARYVKPEDQKDFLGYAKNFVNVLTTHHDCEEESLFVAIEKMSGEADGAEAYDGDRVVKIIDGFGGPLFQHLINEIQCLVELRRFGPERMKGLADALKAEGQAHLKKNGFLGGVVFAFLGHDATWENGIWADSPPAPPGLEPLVMKELYYWHSA